MRSGLLRQHRRYFAVAAFGLLATPLVVGVVRPDSPAAILKEGRYVTPAPQAPVDGEGWLKLPKDVDAYLQDHFGLREKMIRLHKDVTKPLVFKENNVAINGDSGRFYAIADGMVLQSAGRVFRQQRVADAAELIVTMRDALRKRGIAFLVALPPNSSTVYPDDLPYWARNPGKKTEYDALLETIEAQGVRAVDLRPALSLARLDGPTYLINDLHWNVRGAVSGFNAIVDADGRPDWHIDPSSAIGPLAERRGGDIATLLGIEDSVRETTETLALPSAGTTIALSDGPEGRIGAAKDMTDHMIVTGKPGATVLVIGDSFTTNYFPVFLAQHVGRAIWIHHQYCGFDWTLIDKLKPDEVWWTPVERFLVCQQGQYPHGLRMDAGLAR
jgi:alginate O-acetyltransferase complex protein AlgJ